METIILKQEDIEKLPLIESKGSESILYRYTYKTKPYVLKVFRHNLFDQRHMKIYYAHKSQMIQLLNKNDHKKDFIIVPEVLVKIRHSDRIAYLMREESGNNFDIWYKKENHTALEVLKVLMQVSKNLEELHHDTPFTISDLSAKNIILPEDLTRGPLFADTDSFQYGRVISNATVCPTVFQQLYPHLCDYVKCRKSNDRILLLFLFLRYVLRVDPMSIAFPIYSDKIHKLSVNQKTKEMLFSLRNVFPQVDYLHYFIDESEYKNWNILKSKERKAYVKKIK